MSKKINNIKDTIQFLKDNIPIQQVVSEATEVIQSGPDSYKALCCFHGEKTPSLMMTPSKGLYHCFGCKASGDVVSFYKDYYHISTTEAIYKLANTYGLDLTPYERELTDEEREKEEYARVCKKLQENMTQNLLDGVGSGLSRLEDREIFTDIIKEFGIGYTNQITDVLDGIDPKYTEILELDTPNMYIDALIYPLYDPYGTIVGFKTRPSWGGKLVDRSGRKLPKFMGTSKKFPLFIDNELYGFHIARKHMENGELVIVEGQHDVLSLHQVGVRNVAGSDGSAINLVKLKQLKDFGVRTVIIMYDGDAAGEKGAIRVAEESIKNNLGMAIKIARLPKDKDPDELVREGRVLEVREAIEHAVYGSQYLIDNIINGHKLDDITDKLDCMKRISPLINGVSPIEHDFVLQYIADKLGSTKGLVDDTIRFYQDQNKDVLIYNIDGEKIVLGEMLRNPEFRIRALTDMKTKDFYLGKHQIIFDMIREMVEQVIEIQPDTIMTVINNKGYKQLLNNGNYIQDIMLNFGEAIPAMEDILDKSVRRAVIDQSKQLIASMTNLSTNTPVTIDEAITGIEKACGGVEANKPLRAEQGAEDFMARLHSNMKHAGEITGIKLGNNFNNLTELINGLCPKKLVTVAANQSVGKTTILCNWLNEICVNQKKPWVHFTLEMSKEEIVDKIIAMRAGVSTQQIARGNLTDEEYRRVQEETINYYNGGLIIIDDKTTLEQITSDIRNLIRSDKIVGASIDYIQLMQIEKSKHKARWEDLGECSGVLKNDVAKKLGIPVVILSQLNKSATKADIASAEDGSGSYKIAQDSDIYITLKRKTEEEILDGGGIEAVGNITLNLDKNRGGQRAVLEDIFFEMNTQRMQELNI